MNTMIYSAGFTVADLRTLAGDLVWVGLVHLGLDSSPAGALAGETASAADPRPWLATLSRDELTELVIEAAQGSLEGRRGLYIRGSIELPDGSTGTWPN